MTASRSKRVKVCDFGIAKVSWSEPDEGDEALTEAGRVIGTPQYMSPEQCQAEEVDHRSDLYSLGCVMYFLVVGHHAISGPTPLTTMLMQVQGDRPSAQSAEPGRRRATRAAHPLGDAKRSPTSAGKRRRTQALPV